MIIVPQGNRVGISVTDILKKKGHGTNTYRVDPSYKDTLPPDTGPTEVMMTRDNNTTGTHLT